MHHGGMTRQAQIVVRIVEDVGSSYSNPKWSRQRNLQGGKPNVKRCAVKTNMTGKCTSHRQENSWPTGGTLCLRRYITVFQIVTSLIYPENLTSITFSSAVPPHKSASLKAIPNPSLNLIGFAEPLRNPDNDLVEQLSLCPFSLDCSALVRVLPSKYCGLNSSS